MMHNLKLKEVNLIVNQKHLSYLINPINQMKINSNSYASQGNVKYTSANANQKSLAEQNSDLAKKVESALGVDLTRNKSGVWVLSDGTELYKISDYQIGKILAGQFHSGGIVGDDSIKANEKLAILKDNEWVLSERMVSNLTKQMDRISSLKEKMSAFSLPYPDSIARDIVSGAGGVISNITNNRPVSITFGDTVIHGSGTAAAAQHIKINENMINELARMLGVRR